MAQPLIIAHHLIWTGYGWWLPNDPRGSGSTEIRRDVLAELGELHHGRKSVQPPRQDLRQFQAAAASLLAHPRLCFDEGDRREIATAFEQVIAEQRYTCYACAIMPDHVHVLIRKHKHFAEDMTMALSERSGERLRSLRPRFAGRPVWTSGTGWKVFLDEPDEIHRTIRYILTNPVAQGEPEQQWPFVTEYDGWPLHPGHSPNSPYAKLLREAGRYPR